MVYKFFVSCMTNYHKFSNLEQHTFVTSQSLWVRSLDPAYPVPLLRVSTGCKKVVGQKWSLIWRLEWGKICFPTSMVVSSIQSLAVVGLRTLVFCLLLGRGCPQLLTTLASSVQSLTSSSLRGQCPSRVSLLARWSLI